MIGTKSRMHILALVYASKSYLLIKAHQPHGKEFMVHLGDIVAEKLEYARDCDIEDRKWVEIKTHLKPCGENTTRMTAK